MTAPFVPESDIVMSTPFCLLIGEDNRATREGYREYFEQAGFVVHATDDGHRVLQLARNVGPSVILLDLELPGLDGWEIARQVKASATTCHIPIIALTGHTHRHEQASAFRAGCDVFLAKPCEPSRLLAEIRKILGAQESSSA